MYAGPDGALYVIDMYRGIIQHKTYLTPYLSGEAIARGLETPLNCGRIYRVSRKGTTLSAPVFKEDNKDSLLSYLSSSNKWLRETAHNFIIDQQLISLSPALYEMMKTENNLIGKINAMWVLEGLHELHNNDLQDIWSGSSATMKQQILTAAIAIMHHKQDADFWLDKYKAMMDENTPGLAPYLAYLGAAAMKYTSSASDLILSTVKKYQKNPYVADAFISGLKNKEKSFLGIYTQTVKDTADFFVKRLDKVINNAEKQRLSAIANKKLDKDLMAGRELFKANCQVCHGEDGAGIKGLGAPLDSSNWVQGNKDKLLSIVLYGVAGPIKVGDKTYALPDVAGAMPGMSTNEKLGDKEIAGIASYIRQAWSNKASKVADNEVKTIRQKYRGRVEPLTMKELMH